VTFRKRSRNLPPDSGIRVPAEAMHKYVSQLFGRVDMPPQDAEIMARLLVATDLRCVFSHGTQRVPGYVAAIRDGRVNPRPNVTTVSDFPGGVVMDGDGGMGHLPCFRATETCITKARTCGVAAATTRNHFHFGAASKYTLMAVAQDCIGLSASSHRFFDPGPDATPASACTSSPLSIAIPAGQQPPLVLDMGGVRVPATEELLAKIPGAVFKSLGLSMAIISLGGFFAGIYSPELIPPASPWESNQGSFLLFIDAAHFMPIDELKAEMDRYVGRTRGLKPLPGEERAETAGGAEWEWEQYNRVHGIPVGPEHEKALQTLADDLGVMAPFEAHENTRFQAE
jgi:L-2-hydroxycarboxylate dehydrogenase (NAD+)